MNTPILINLVSDGDAATGEKTSQTRAGCPGAPLKSAASSLPAAGLMSRCRLLPGFGTHVGESLSKFSSCLDTVSWRPR